MFWVGTCSYGQWIEQRLKSFGFAGQAASNPAGQLIIGADRSLYGTSFYGGNEGGGTVFKVNTNGDGLTVLYSFRRSSGDGENPSCKLAQGSDGFLYATTTYG